LCSKENVGECRTWRDQFGGSHQFVYLPYVTHSARTSGKAQIG